MAFVFNWLAYVPLLLQAAAAAPVPPKPDFKTEVDYAAWIETYVTSGLKKEQNAAPLYTAIFGEPNDSKAKPLLFNGPRTQLEPVKEIGPWDPAKHADWEKAYQDTKEIVQQFKAAAARPYAWWGVRIAPPPGEPKLLVYALMGELSKLRQLAKGASENAWRARDGKVNEVAFVASCRAQLGVARQSEKNPMLISMLVGIATRQLAYSDLLLAADLEILREKERANVLLMLKSQDGPIASPRYWLSSELAINYDMIQMVHKNGEGRFGVDAASGTITLKGELRCDTTKARDAVATSFETTASEWDKPYDAETMDRIAAAEKKCADADPLARVLTPGLGRAAQLRLRAEAVRRGTRLVYEILAYHDKNKKWPASLKDLPPDNEKGARIDPFSNKPFAYRIENDKPLLYSVSQDAKDDDGKTHDAKWGDEEKDVDYIIWPVQK